MESRGKETGGNLTFPTYLPPNRRINGTPSKVFTSAQVMAGTATSISGRVLSFLVRKAAVPVEAEEEPTGLLPQVLIACTCLQIALLFLVMHRHNCATCPKKNAATKLQAGAACTVARLDVPQPPGYLTSGRPEWLWARKQATALRISWGAAANPTQVSLTAGSLSPRRARAAGSHEE